MSYTILDGKGHSKGDLCTVRGIEELEDVAGDALAEFLDTGEADAALADEIREEVKDDPKLDYITKLLDGEPPFVLSGGIEDEEDL